MTTVVKRFLSKKRVKILTLQVISNVMTDTQKEEGKKTVVSFIVGLLIGGLLVWAFSGNPTEAPTPDTNETATTTVEEEAAAEPTAASEEETEANTATPSMTVGEGAVMVNDQTASTRIVLDSVTFPIAEGWVGVRDYTNETLGPILGVVRFSESQGLVPQAIQLQYATRPGREYAVVFFSEDGDRQFNLATDVQIDRVFATFSAQ